MLSNVKTLFVSLFLLAGYSGHIPHVLVVYIQEYLPLFAGILQHQVDTYLLHNTRCGQQIKLDGGECIVL